MKFLDSAALRSRADPTQANLQPLSNTPQGTRSDQPDIAADEESMGQVYGVRGDGDTTGASLRCLMGPSRCSEQCENVGSGNWGSGGWDGNGAYGRNWQGEEGFELDRNMGPSYYSQSNVNQIQNTSNGNSQNRNPPPGDLRFALHLIMLIFKHKMPGETFNSHPAFRLELKVGV